MARKRKENEETNPLGIEADAAEDVFVVRHEETADVSTGWRGVGFLRARRRVDAIPVRTEIPTRRDDVALERVPAAEGDSGRIETLPDGSISIPIYEEELVVTRRAVLKERVIVRKDVVTETQKVDADLRKERVEFDADQGVEVVDESGAPLTSRSEAPTQVMTPYRGTRPLIETRPFWLTSEFFAAVLAIVALAVATVVSDAIDVQLFWILAIAVTAMYVTSRGFANSNSEHG